MKRIALYSDLDSLQPKESNELNTTAKTIVGAINENKGHIGGLLDRCPQISNSSDDEGKVLTVSDDGTAQWKSPIDLSIFKRDGTIEGVRTVTLDSILKILSYNDNQNIGQASKQLRVGLCADNVNGYITDGAALHVTQKQSASGQNPVWLSLSCPDSGSANGVAIYGYGDNGKIRPELHAHSNYAESNPTGTDIGLAIKAVIAEIDGADNAGLIISGAKAQGNGFARGGALLLDSTKVFGVKNGATYGQSYLMYVRTKGDFHVAGCLFLSTSKITANTAVSLDRYRYINTGGAITITLPEPSICEGREHLILNHGTGIISFNYPLWLDALTAVSSLDYAFPDNQLHIFSDGTKWIAYR